MYGPATTTRAHQKALLKLSPFELKDSLIDLAQDAERDEIAQFLNAGRGNPNWICTTAREAFGTLLRFGLEESKRGVTIPDFGKKILSDAGIAKRYEEFLQSNPKAPGIKLLRDTWEYATKDLKLNPDAFAYELGEGIIGDLYPICSRSKVARLPCVTYSIR
jgi:aspartate 4-decarboxylase